MHSHYFIRRKLPDLKFFEEPQNLTKRSYQGQWRMKSGDECQNFRRWRVQKPPKRRKSKEVSWNRPKSPSREERERESPKEAQDPLGNDHHPYIVGVDGTSVNQRRKFRRSLEKRQLLMTELPSFCDGSSVALWRNFNWPPRNFREHLAELPLLAVFDSFKGSWVTTKRGCNQRYIYFGLVPIDTLIGIHFIDHNQHHIGWV